MPKVYHGIGLMSGTSLDGLDIAYCSFEETQTGWSNELLNSICIGFPNNLRDELASATKLSSEGLCNADIHLGNWIGRVVKEFITQENISPQFIASHGHTVFHQPEKGFTLQIGSGEEIYKATQIPVINNFRQLDVSFGGQGAPLVPIGDKLLFGQYDMCVNLGGIANISFDQNEERVAYDICPVNMVLNFLAEKKGKVYDESGEMARGGKLLPSLYEKLETLSYYNSTHPKSLGSEWVRDEILSLDDFNSESPEDLSHTFVHHIATRVKHAVSISPFSETANAKILVTGGGSYNIFLLNELEKSLAGRAILSNANNELIDYKEALIFAFLGLLRLKDTVNCLKSVTGASTDSCGGSLIGVNPYH